MALIFFLTAVFASQNQNNKNGKHMVEMEENQNDLLCSPPSATKEHLFLNAFLIHLFNQCAQRMIEVRRMR